VGGSVLTPETPPGYGLLCHLFYTSITDGCKDRFILQYTTVAIESLLCRPMSNTQAYCKVYYN